MKFILRNRGNDACLLTRTSGRERLGYEFVRVDAFTSSMGLQGEDFVHAARANGYQWT